MLGGKHAMPAMQQKIYNLQCCGLEVYLMQKIVGAHGTVTKPQSKIILANRSIKLLMARGIMVSGQVIMVDTWAIFIMEVIHPNIFSNILKFLSLIIF